MPYHDIVQVMCDFIEMVLVNFQSMISGKDKIISDWEEQERKRVEEVEKSKKEAAAKKKAFNDMSELEKVKHELEREKRHNGVYLAQIKMYKAELRELTMITKDVKVTQIYDTLVKLVEKHVETETQVRKAEDH